MLIRISLLCVVYNLKNDRSARWISGLHNLVFASAIGLYLPSDVTFSHRRIYEGAGVHSEQHACQQPTACVICITPLYLRLEFNLSRSSV